MPVYNYTTLDDAFQVDFTTGAIGINDAGQIVGGTQTPAAATGFSTAGVHTRLSTIRWPPRVLEQPVSTAWEARRASASCLDALAYTHLTALRTRSTIEHRSAFGATD